MINSVTLYGNCASEVKLNQKGQATLLLAYDESYKDSKSNKVERTSFLWIYAYGQLARNLSEFVSKGDPISLQGKLSGGTYRDANGDWQNGLRVKAQSIQFHYRKPKSNEQQGLPPMPQDEELALPS